MITAIDRDGMRECATTGCDERFSAVEFPRSKYCLSCKGVNSTRTAKRAERRENPLFICVDGEGTGQGRAHKYVLLGIGQAQREWPDGARDITEIFAFLYNQFRANPGAVFAGFFLQYDWNMWLRLLPRGIASLLYHPESGPRVRKCKHPKCQGRQRCIRGPHPVQFRGWEFDILDRKRFKLRPACGVAPGSDVCMSNSAHDEWMWICDAGSFYQSALLTAINPGDWNEPVVSQEEYDLLVAGKSRRDSAELDDDMRMYNRLENEILARLLTRLHHGLSHATVNLKKHQWFGPGQAAQVWMRQIKTLEAPTKAVHDLAERKLKLRQLRTTNVKQPEDIYEALVAGYYGGWFEIPVHGHISSTAYEYDLNSAYPWAASKLPCLCGQWTTGTGTPTKLTHHWLLDPANARSPRDRKLRICRAIVKGADPHLGGLPYRKPDGSVLRPREAKGWWWQHELDAARQAGLISEITYGEWIEYTPCAHKPPLQQLEGLYESRLRVGKDTPEGKAFKLIYNSVYGKLCQSLGDAPYGNPAYAGLITSACRTRILLAIATHPDRSAAVAMVATDGVYFMKPHPEIERQISGKLGEWGGGACAPERCPKRNQGKHKCGEKHGLTVFKPGVYWDDVARQAIADGKTAKFKSRGVNAADFSKAIARIDREFKNWDHSLPDLSNPENWPSVPFRSRFAQISIKQALSWTDGADDGKLRAKYKGLAGLVCEGKELIQNSDAKIKRDPAVTYDPVWKVYRSRPWQGGHHWDESTPYERKFGLEDTSGGFAEHDSPDGPALLTFRSMLGVG